MKFALAALGLALVTATSAAAMIGPYERAVNENPAAYGTVGTTGHASASQTAASPEADWNNGEARQVTIFSSQGAVTGAFEGR